MPEAKNYYRILQVSRSATLEQIKIAFRQLARQYHPDLHPNDLFCEEKFKEISEAYQVLVDFEKRSQYDRNHQDNFQQDQSSPLSYQDFYVRGINQVLEENYQVAIYNYNEAIKLKSDFLEAYVKRCEAYFQLKEYQKVLSDCQSILKINSHCFQAYYYQGRSRQRLGYIEGAIEAYNQSLNLELDQESASVYYYRGLAYDDLGNQSQALSDLKKAANLFKIQGNLEGLNLARKRIVFLNNSFNIGRLISDNFIFRIFFSILKIVWLSSIHILVDPGGRLLSSWAKLKSAQALMIGFLYGVVANILFVNSLYFKSQGSLSKELLIKFFILEFIPLLSLIGVSLVSLLVCRRHLDFVATVFLSGVSLLPFILLVSSDIFIFDLTNFIKFVGGIFAGCYSLFILYNGCLQIYNLSEKTAALTSAIMLTITSLNVWFVL